MEFFDFNGFVGLRHLTSEWMRNFQSLEEFSAKFRDVFPEWGGGYPWPADPLYYWFRPFEYPYVLNNLAADGRELKIVDIGSAVTFLIPLLASRGWTVQCFDCDASMPMFWNRAKCALAKHGFVGLSDIGYDTMRDGCIPLQSDSCDAVTCISVLEHVDDPPALLSDMIRVAKPSGLIILTMDVSLDGASGVSVKDFALLTDLLDRTCVPAHRCELTHPQDLLVWPATPRGLVAAPRRPAQPTLDFRRRLGDPRRALSAIAARLRIRKAEPPRSLCVFVGAFRKTR